MEYILTKGQAEALGAALELKAAAGRLLSLYEERQEAFKVRLYTVQEEELVHGLACMGSAYEAMVEEAVLSGRLIEGRLMEVLADWVLSQAAGELLEEVAERSGCQGARLYDADADQPEVAAYVFERLLEAYPELETVPVKTRLATVDSGRPGIGDEAAGCSGCGHGHEEGGGCSGCGRHTDERTGA